MVTEEASMSKGKKLALFGGVLLVLIAAVVVIAILQSQGIMPTGEESSEESLPHGSTVRWQN